MRGSRAARWASALGALAAASGCSEAGLAGAEQSPTNGFEGGDSGLADGGGDGARGRRRRRQRGRPGACRVVAPCGHPSEVVEGRASPSGSSLQVVSLDANAVVRCTAAAPVERVTTLSPPEPEILAWWQLIVGDWSGDCVDAGEAVPLEVIQLGVGSLHPEILAVLERVPGAAAGSDLSLSGAYARLETGGPVYVFGAAGLSGAYLGEGGTPTEAPLPDGSWRIEPVYAFNGADGW